MISVVEDFTSVLVVDDEASICKMVASVLADLGCEETFTAPDAETALDVIASEHPNVIITDVKLPGMDGVELARRVKAESGGTPVVLMSAYSEPPHHHADAFIAKPFNIDELAVLLGQYFDLA